jgi:hypothetical protein
MPVESKSGDSAIATWYGQIFACLDFSEVGKQAGLDLETEPAWISKVIAELVQQAMPAFRMRKAGRVTPRVAGLCLGQLSANLFVFSGLMKRSMENVSALKTLENHNTPAVQSALGATEALKQSLAASMPLLENFDRIAVGAFQSALAQPSHAEAAEFFQGFAQGMSKPGLTNTFRLVGATTATLIYLKLLVERRTVERFHSVRELRDFLLQQGLSEQVLGEPKRLEKLCERIKLSFTKRGRPKKTE